MSARQLRVVLAIVAAILVGLVARELRFSTDITHFLPADESHELAAISRALTRTSLGRTMVLSIEPAEPAGEASLETALDAAASLAQALRPHPAVREVRAGTDPALQRDIYELYFPRRMLLLSDAPEREIPELIEDASLHARAVALRNQLAMPTGTLIEQVAPADPLGSFARILQRFGGAQGGLRVEGGRFVSAQGRGAILILATDASGFDSSVQGPLLDDIAAAWGEVAARHPGLVLEMSGANRFAVSAERSIRRDTLVIGACSALGVAALFFLFMRSAGAFGLAILPGVFGILAAAAGGVLVLGGLDGLTLAFGTSLIGVAIDYSIHLMNHFARAPVGRGAREVARRLRPSLVLGALTTMASFAGLGLTSMRAFQEIAFVAVVGVGVALLFTLIVLPVLLEKRRPATPLATRAAGRLVAWVARLGPHRPALAVLLAVVGVAAAVALPALRWNDDLRALSAGDPALEAEDRRVRARVSPYDPGRAVIALGGSEEEALARNDAVHARLEAARARGELEALGSLHALLWSADLQRRNWSQLTLDPTLPDRLDQAFEGAGFRPGAFRPFAEAIRGPAPAPLTLDTLRTSPLAPLVEPQTLQVGERTGIVTLLRGVRSLAEVEHALGDLDEVYVLDQGAFINDIYATFRSRTVRQAGVGALLVIAVLLVRYRRLRPAFAAFVPSALVAVSVLGVFAALGVETTLIHAVSLLLVMGMGVDYGIFLVDSADDDEAFAATMLSLLLSCLTTVFVFGTLALSSQPALRAMGVTTGAGILLSFLFAPLALVVSGGRR